MPSPALTYLVKPKRSSFLSSATDLFIAESLHLPPIFGACSTRRTGLRVAGSIARGGSETWAEVSEYGGSVTLRVVERRAMAQEVEASADALAKDLAATGHAAVYGILFDTGSADLRPESGAALGELARLLAAQPGLRLRLVGHTDAVGDLAANQRLSEARAAAALSALATMHGVDRARLSAHGVGPLCPVATNDSDEGRARNRRVELVPW